MASNFSCRPTVHLNGYFVSSTFPHIDRAGKVWRVDQDTLFVYYYGDKILRRSTYLSDSMGILENRYFEIVYSIKDSSALLIVDGRRSDLPTRVNKDSVLELDQVDFSRDFNIKTLLRLGRSSTGTSEISDSYEFFDSATHRKRGTVMLKYLKAEKKIPHSMFPTADTIKNMNLGIIEIVNFPQIYDGVKIDQIISRFESGKIEVKNKEEILAKFAELSKLK